jgi:FkbM family methyltransferase
VDRRYQFQAGGESPFIIDCGAGLGAATLFWARRWRGARVLALEPDPAVLPLLRRNVAAAGEQLAARVEIRAQALWREAGARPFVSMPDGRGRVVDDPVRGVARHLVQVESVSLAQLLDGRQVDMLKMTVAGAEHGLFVEPGLFGGVARVYVDCHFRRGHPGRLEGILATLREAGFALHLQSEPLAPRPFLWRGEEEGTLQRVQIYAYRG